MVTGQPLCVCAKANLFLFLPSRYVLEDATSASLVLVDELGKGTEVGAGAALAGAMLERLDATGCRVRACMRVCVRACTRICQFSQLPTSPPPPPPVPLQGMFATHLHALLTMDLTIPHTRPMQMEITEQPLATLGASSGSDGSTSAGAAAAAAAAGGRTGGPSAAEHAQHDERPTQRAQRAPTWRIVPGSSTESLALEVATKCRLPPEVVDRAAHLLDSNSNSKSNSNTSGVAARLDAAGGAACLGGEGSSGEGAWAPGNPPSHAFRWPLRFAKQVRVHGQGDGVGGRGAVRAGGRPACMRRRYLPTCELRRQGWGPGTETQSPLPFSHKCFFLKSLRVCVCARACSRAMTWQLL
jgi:hypothetical protein